MSKAKPPVTVESANAAPTGTAGAAEAQELPPATTDLSMNSTTFNQLNTIAPGPLPLWTINSAGALQRSLDKGHTWQNINVTAPVTLSFGLVGGQVAAKTSSGKEKDADQKLEKQAAAPFVFRAVSAQGTDVWAGGSQGMLYHSLDGGNQWTRVVPSAAGAQLAGDIVSLEFSDSRHGKITTSVPEVWTTSDDGQSWQKQ